MLDEESMTPDEEARLRVIVEREMMAWLLGTSHGLPRTDIDFAQDMHWLYRAQYNNIVKELREKYNMTRERQQEIKENRLHLRRQGEL